MNNSDFKVGKLYASKYFIGRPIILILRIEFIGAFAATCKYLDISSLAIITLNLIREDWIELS